MGTEGGMLVFSPDSIVKQTYEAPIVVTGIKYSEDNLSHVLSDADYLEIPTRRRNFTISFAALDYTNSLDIEYAYKLDAVSYTHLAFTHQSERIPAYPSLYA